MIFPGRLRHHTVLPSSIITAEKEILPSGHHCPHPIGYQMKEQAKAQQMIGKFTYTLLSFHAWKELLGNTENPRQLASPKPLLLTPLPFLWSGLVKQCSNTSVCYQELLLLVTKSHVIHDFLCTKEINCLAISVTTCARNPE